MSPSPSAPCLLFYPHPVFSTFSDFVPVTTPSRYRLADLYPRLRRHPQLQLIVVTCAVLLFTVYASRFQVAAMHTNLLLRPRDISITEKLAINRRDAAPVVIRR